MYIFNFKIVFIGTVPDEYRIFDRIPLRYFQKLCAYGRIPSDLYKSTFVGRANDFQLPCALD